MTTERTQELEVMETPEIEETTEPVLKTTKLLVTIYTTGGWQKNFELSPAEYTDFETWLKVGDMNGTFAYNNGYKKSFILRNKIDYVDVKTVS